MKKINLNVFVVLFFCCICLSCKKNNPDVTATSQNLMKNLAAAVTGKDYYVATPTNGGKPDNSGTDDMHPLDNIRAAAALTKPGDRVNIMAGGVFKRTGTEGVILTTSISGTVGNVITFRGYPVGGTRPVIQGYSMFQAVGLSGVSYINIEGLEVIGDKGGTAGGPALTLAGANAASGRARTYYLAHNNSLAGYTYPDADIPYQTSGINIDGGSHDITISNCLVHDMPGSGIGGSNCDNVIFEDNTVYNCANFNLGAVSGIGFIKGFNSPVRSGGYQLIIRRNKSFNNSSIVNYYVTGAPSDGNGIIIDVNRILTGASVDYTGKTLVENNISYNNGGGGIHMVGAQTVDVRNNTCYNNGQKLNYAEMDASFGSKKVNFWSNIMYARNNGKCLDNPFGGIKNDSIVFYKNVLYNNFQTITAVNDVDGFTNTDFRTSNPNFYTPGSDFRINTGSSAANFGSGVTNKYALDDFVKTVRILNPSTGQYPDCGAYENFR